jgi:putative FmdB family regulatory protein
MCADSHQRNNMPIYEYACQTCFQSLDVARPIDERDSTEFCPDCDKPMARKYKAPGITFNGPGFYKTGG